MFPWLGVILFVENQGSIEMKMKGIFYMLLTFEYVKGSV
jgi:hypothetical protein